MKLIAFSDKTLALEPVFAKSVTDESTVLVFLHEALGSIGQWKSFPQNLCNAVQLNGVVYEREGYGSSSPLKEQRDEMYLHNYALVELPALIDKIIPEDKRIILVGHSDGASIALLYAAKYPNRVKAVVSMAAHVIVEDVTLQGIEPAVRAYEAGKLEGLKKYHGEKTDTLFYAWATTWNLLVFRDWNICSDIQPITCPILAIQGVNDQYGTAKQVELIKEAALHSAVEILLLTNCGHHPHLEQPEKVIHAVSGFLNA
ncbi:MAG: alpha/beta hydrolase [Crocinitomicaceae bacterium]|nr:alpha/beta hydrolase [Crocinitomicaceae bacterium]